MIMSLNRKKYDDLLALFLANNQPAPKEETEEMENWLNEAANGLRSSFRQYRGKMKNMLMRWNNIFNAQIISLEVLVTVK